MKILIPLTFFFLFFIFPSVNANTLTFVDYGLTAQEVDIYYSNGTLLDTVYSNESVTLDSSFDYQVVLRPEKFSILADPTILFDYFWAALPIIITLAIAFGLYSVISWKKVKPW